MKANDAATLLADLVAINSVNPDLVPGAKGEAAIARFVASWFERRGIAAQLVEVQPGRPNVVAVVKGRGEGRSLLLNGHLDTVGVAGMAEPLTARIEAGRLYGRGAYDMKGGVAAAMLATARAAALELAGDVIFTGVMDEEHAGLGTQAIAAALGADGAIVAEPTELELAIAHKGFVWFELETSGIAAHGSRPHLGVDAIVTMGKFLVELAELDRRLRSGPLHPLLGGGSIHASLITGGQEMSSYPERCRLSLERRTIPGQDGAGAEAELEGLLAGLSRADPEFRAVLSCGLERAPLETPADHPVVTAVADAAEAVLGRTLGVSGVSFWADSATLSAAGIPTVLFGPLGAGAHAAEEWVDLESVEQCAAVYLETARRFCA